MTSPDVLTYQQLAQRIDELKGVLDISPEVIQKRLTELESYYEAKVKGNFNHGVVTPLPPDHVDIDNSSVVTPKSPEQVEREYNDWVKGLDK